MPGCHLYVNVRETHTWNESMKNVRVNLTISEPVAAAIEEVAELTGQSMSAAIASFLAWKLPELREWVAGYWIAVDRSVAPLPVSATAADSPGQSTGSGAAEVRQIKPVRSGSSEVLSRAERRRQERELARLDRQMGGAR